MSSPVWWWAFAAAMAAKASAALCPRTVPARVLFCSPVDSHRAALLQCASHHPRILRLGVPRLGTSALTLRRHGVVARQVIASAAERLPLNLPEGPRVHLQHLLPRVIGSRA